MIVTGTIRTRQHISRSIAVTLLAPLFFASLQTFASEIFKYNYPVTTTQTALAVWVATLITFIIGVFATSACILVNRDMRRTDRNADILNIAFLIAWIPFLTLLQVASDVSFELSSSDSSQRLMITGITTAGFLVLVTVVGQIVYVTCDDDCWSKVDSVVYDYTPTDPVANPEAN